MKTGRTKQLVVTGFVTLALMATACGSTAPVSTAAAPNAAAVADGQVVTLAVDGEMRSMIDGLTSLHGDSAGNVALVNALERGYDYLQIRDAIANQALKVDGRISDAGGEVAPNGRRADVVLLPDDPGADEGALAPTRFLARFQADRQPSDELVANMSTLDVQLRDIDSGSAANAEVTKGQAITAAIISLARSGYTLDQIIEVLVFQTARIGVNDSNCAVIVGDGNVRPKGSLNNTCSRSVHAQMDDLDEADARQDDIASDNSAPEDLSAPGQPMQLLWQGEMTPDPEWVTDPVSGTFKLTRTAGTDDFQITVSTADAKSGTFTTDGFNEVECGSEWGSTFEGTGTFWDVNDLGIEFTGQITRSIVYTSGPCDSVLEPETTDFSGVVVFVTEDGIELGFNAWNITLVGPPPVPIGD